MKRTEFERVSPESVGISGASVHRLLNRLESGFTEMHGLQIMRHGKICAEGWWSPYAPGIRHNLMSVTKTYVATAIGIALTEGLLKLSDRIVDIFSHESPAHPSENLARLTIHDVLCMGNGMESTPDLTADWIADFIATDVVHRPGTRFFYNSVGSSLLGAIIQRKTGQSIDDYLAARLFEPLGIDAANLRWAHMPDGTPAGGAGLYATTEDNLRLMKLYMDGGDWEGKRILSANFVQAATSKQIDTAIQAASYPFAADSFCGYGYQIWMCAPDGVYRADGAMGQFCVVCPRQDLIISITETGRGIDGPQKTLDAIWEFLETVSGTPLPEDPAASACLQKRLTSLSLPRPAYRPYSPMREQISHMWFDVTNGTLGLENRVLSLFCGLPVSAGIRCFRFLFDSHHCMMEFSQDSIDRTVQIALDGSRAQNTLSIAYNTATCLYLSGYWAAADRFVLVCRWIETSFEKELHFSFHGSDCVITTIDPLQSCGPTGEMNDPPVRAALRAGQQRT